MQRPGDASIGSPGSANGIAIGPYPQEHQRNWRSDRSELDGRHLSRNERSGDLLSDVAESRDTDFQHSRPRSALARRVH